MSGVVDVDVAEQPEPERGCLAAAGPGLGDHVAAGEHRGQHRGLDRRHLGVAEGVEVGQHGGRERETGEGEVHRRIELDRSVARTRPSRQAAAMDPRVCPSCGASTGLLPDALGVSHCPTCAIEFRAGGRMPIRGATVNLRQVETTPKGAVIGLLVVVAVIGGSIAASNSDSTSPGTSLDALPPVRFGPPPLDPALFAFEGIAFDPPFGQIPLAHTVHLSRLSDTAVFITGVVQADGPVEEVGVEVHCRDASGRLLASPRAVVACPQMRASERCAWMLDVSLPAGVTELEFDAHARPDLGLVAHSLDLSSERGDALEFDRERGTIELVVGPGERAMWATVTAYDPRDRVLGVAHTRWAKPLELGRQNARVAVPELRDQVARFELRVGDQP